MLLCLIAFCDIILLKRGFMSLTPERVVPKLDTQDFSQHRLDIVRDCADLAGQFPPNVTFDFVFRGLDDIWGQEKEDSLKNLADHAAEADVVAMEVDYNYPPALRGRNPGPYTERLFELLSNDLRRRGPEEFDEAAYEELRAYGEVYRSLDFYKMRNRFLRWYVPPEDVPRFIPVGPYADQSFVAHAEDQNQWQHNPTDETLFRAAQSVRSQEGTMLRQLLEAARHLAEESDKPNPRIMVALGSMHWFIPVAINELGTSQVKHSFQYSPIPVVAAYPEYAFRLLGPESDHQPAGFVDDGVEELVQAEIEALNVLNHLSMKFRHVRYLRKEYVKDRVAVLLIQIALGHADPEQQQAWERMLAQARSFKRPFSLDKVFGRKAMAAAFEEFKESTNDLLPHSGYPERPGHTG
jgi:hypothetical protein